MGLRIRERVNEGPGTTCRRTNRRWRRLWKVQHSGIEIEKRLEQRCAIVQRRRRSFDHTHLESHVGV